MKTWTYVLPECASDADYENQTCDDNGKYIVLEGGVIMAEFETLDETEAFIKQ